MNKFYLLVFALVCFLFSHAQISGIKTIPGDYASISAAVSALNSSGVGAGGVTFNVAAGYTETSNIPVITVTGSSTNPIVFQKSGSGANPKISPLAAGTIASSTTLGSNGDGIVVINGGDYITFDGIDLQTGNFTGNGLYEYGYYLKKASATDACKNVTIKNCSITLDKTAKYSFGIFISNISGTSSVTVSGTGGRSENIKIFNNTITNAYGGIQARGYAASSPYDRYDQNIEIGTDGANTISDFGGGSSSVYGIYAIYSNNISINNNVITGGAGTTTTLYGIYLGTGTNSSVNVIGNTLELSTSSTSSTTYAIYSSMGSTGTNNTVTVANNTIQNLTWSTATSGAFYGVYQLATSMTSNVNGNTVKNNTKAGTGASYWVYNANTAANGFANTYNNSVYNNVHSGTGSMYGVYSNPATTTTAAVYSNDIHGLSAAGGTIYGVYTATGTSTDVYKNKIYDLSSSGTAGNVYGIYNSSGTTITLYNNIVGDLRTPDGTETNAVVGLYLAGGTTINAYYNTIYLNALSNSTAGFGTSGVYVASLNSTVELKNNIIANTSVAGPTDGATVAFRYSGTPGTSYSAGSNNNLFYVGTPSANHLIYVEGTTTLANAQQTLGDYKSYIGADAASIRENPPFLSTTGSNANFLHIDPATGTQIEGGGTPIANITTDFDGDTRNVSTPDIGADEGNFTYQDVGNPVIGVTPLAFTCSTADRTFTATIADASGVPTSGSLVPRVYYKKGLNGSWTSSAGSLTTGSSTNGTWNFTIDNSLVSGVNAGDTVYYFVVAQDISTNSNIGSSPGGAAGTNVNSITTFPAAPESYVVAVILNGNYNVGSGGTFATLSAAVNTYNTSCLSGAVTFTLTDTAYTSAETFPIIINANSDASAVNTLTIKPAIGNAAIIRGTEASGALIKLVGADHIIIDGSNNGGSTRDITITNTSTTTPTAIALASSGVGDGASDNVIKNIIINTSATSTSYGISIGGNSAGTAGADNDNNTIQNNYISGISKGVYANGTAAASAGGSDNLIITGNTIDINTTTATTIGIQVGNGVNGLISENSISVETSASGQPTGISIETGFLSSSVTKNVISKALTLGTAGYGGRGITIGTGSAASDLLVANNVIYGMNGSNYTGFGNSSSMGIGIGVIGNSTTLTTIAGGVNLYYNSINLYGDYFGTSTTANKITAALYVGTNASDLDVRDNVFANSMNNPNAVSKNYAVYSAAATPFTTINYNDYFGTSSANSSFIVGYIGSDKTDIAAWRTATSQDVNSIAADPLFNSNTILAPATGSPLVGAGMPVSVTTDIRDVTRSVTTPTIGAYENAGDATPPVINVSAIAYACNTGNQTVSATITDASGVPVTGTLVPRIYYKKNAGGAWFSQPGTLASGTATNGTWNFTIVAADMGGLLTTDVINYYVIAQDATASNNLASSPAGATATDVNTVTSPPVSSLQMVLSGTSLSGNYNVGGGGAYATLTAAVAAYNTGCVTGPVTFTLTDATYSSAETFPIIINANGFASAVNTLTIQPAPNTAVNLTGTSGATASALIKLNGADHVTIDGIHDAAGTNLTIENTSVTGGTAVIWLASTGAGQGATNNTIKNVTLKAGVDQKTTTTTTYGIVIAGSALNSTITSVTGGDDNDNNTIDTCSFTKVRYGIYARGGSITNPNLGTAIKRNIIGSTGFGVDEIGKAGIVVREEDGIQITNNEVRFVGGDYNNITAGSTRAGIALATDASWLPSTVYVRNAVINANIIHDIQDERTGTAVGIIVAGADGTNATNNIVSNNFLYNIKANGTSGNNQAVGIGIAAGNGDKVAFNSMYLSGNTNASTGSTATTTSSFGIRVASASATNLSVLNNIVYMDISSTPATPKNFCIDIPTGYSWGTGDLNYNDWYANPGNAQSATGSINNGATAYVGLTTWSAAVSKDANSKELDPQFQSFTDLHLQPSSPLDGQGTVVAGVTKDIDNETRDVNTPDIGADELPAAAGLDVKSQALVSPAVSLHGCYAVEDFVVSIKNNGSTAINFAGTPVTVTVNVSGAPPVPIVKTKTINTGTLAAGAVMDVIMDAAGIDMNLQPGVYIFDITTTVAGDVNTANDNLQETRTGESLTYGSTVVTPTEYCNTGGKPVLTATGANGYSSLQWQQSTTSGSGFTDIPGATGLTFTVPANITQTMFYKLLANCSSYTDESGESVVVLNNPAPLTTTPATRCGTGTVTLGATADAGATINWYSAATGGSPITSGSSFTTPSLTHDSTFYVGVVNGGTSGITVPGDGAWNHVTTAGGYQTTTITGSYLILTVSQTLTLSSMDIYPSASVGTTFGLEARTGSASGTTVKTYSGTTTVTNGTTPSVAQVVPVNWTLTPGTYYIGFTSNPSTWRSGSVAHAYPWSVAGLVSMQSSLTTYQYYFYNLKIATGCEGTRVPVTATVTTAPALNTVTATPAAICEGQTSTLSVTSGNSNYTYNWNPIGLSGSSVAVTPATTSTYTVVATDAITGCVNSGNVSVTVNPLPSAITFTPASVTLCPNSPAQQLSFTGGTLNNVPILSEDFNGTAAGWTTVNNTTNAATNWTSRPDGYVRSVTYHSNDNSQFYLSDADAGSSGQTVNNSLVSPAFSTTGFVSCSMSFYNFYQYYQANEVFIEASTNGTSWTALTPQTAYSATQGSSTSFVLNTIDLTAFAGQPTVYVRFRYNTGWGWRWAIDNLTISGTATSSITWTPSTGLYTDAAGTTPYAGGVASTVYANPVGNALYTATATSGSGCTSTNTVQVTHSSAITNNTTIAGDTTQTCSGNLDVAVSNNFFNSCNIISTVVPSGASPVSGNINACVTVNATVPTAPNNQPYVQRFYEITPSANRTTATSTITLYFTQAEFNAYNAALNGLPTLPTGPADASGIANLRIAQFNHGGVGTGFSTYPAGSGYAITPTSVTYDAAANGGAGMWSVTFNATGSGAFYMYTGAFVLPVTITNFRGEQAGSVNKLFWNTSTETNNKGFELERSSDGISFTKITFVASKANGGNSTSALSYIYDDVRPMSGANYYRLKQIDNDGKFSYSNVVLLIRKLTEITLTGVYPNPTTRELNVKITSPRAEKLTLVVTDLTGKVVMQQPMSVVIGDNQQQMNVAPLAAGTYVVKAICANGCETAVHRFVKQ
jgi:trimeric autotransporter adhesin